MVVKMVVRPIAKLRSRLSAGRTATRREGAVRVPAFPLTGIHPHALAAASAAEAAARQGRFWDMHELLFHRQKALEGSDLRGYAAQLGLDVAAFDRDRASAAVLGPSATWTAAWPRARCSAPPPCSSTASCTAAVTTRAPCWRRCPHEPPCAQPSG